MEDSAMEDAVELPSDIDAAITETLTIEQDVIAAMNAQEPARVSHP